MVDDDELRQRAEAKISGPPEVTASITLEEARRIIHELQVHQIELELQNEDLRQTQRQLEESRTRYADLYDFAPVGYLTLDCYGMIQEANLTAATQLGVNRGRLINSPLHIYMDSQDQERWRGHCNKTFVNPGKQTFEVRLKSKGGDQFDALLESIAVKDILGHQLCRTTITDLTKRKQAEEELKQYRDHLERLVEERTAELVHANKQLKGEFKNASKIEETLREREAHFKLLYERAPLPYQSLDESGNFIYVNQAWLDSLGYTREEVIGKSFGDFLHPDWMDHFKENFPRFKALGEVLGVEFEMVKKDGSILLVSFHGKIGRDVQGCFQQTHCIFQDITDRKRAEEAIIASEKELRQLYESMRDAFVVVDMDGKIVKYNSAYKELIGYDDDDEIAQLTYVDITPEKWHQFEVDIVKDYILPRGYSDVYEKEYRRKDGTIIPIELRTILMRDENSQPTSMWAIIRDITERKQLEEALLSERQKLKTILNTMPDGIYIVNQEHEIEYINPVIEFNFGPIGGRKCYQYFHDRSEICPWCKNQDVFAGRSVRWEWESFKTGKTYDLFDAPITNADGSISKIEFFHDISEQKLSELAIRANEEKYHTLFESMAQGVLYQNAEGIITSANPAAERILGVSLNQLLGRTSNDPRWQIIREDGSTFPSEELPIIVAQRTGQEICGVIMGVFNPQRNAYVWISVNAMPQFREGEDIPYQTYVTFDDVTYSKQVKDILESRLRLMEFANTHSLDELLTATLDEIEALTGSAIGFYHFIDSDGKKIRLQNWSTNTLMNMCTATGKGQEYDISQAGVWTDCIYERRPVIHNDYASLPHRRGMPEGHAPVVRELVVPIIRHNQIVAIIGVGNKPSLYHDRDIGIVSLLGDLSWDIVERKQAETKINASLAEKEVLLKEIHHRVKNNLQIISGLLNMQGRQIKDKQVADMLKDCESRIRSMALVHEVLYRSGDLAKINLKSYLTQLSSSLIKIYNGITQRIRFAIDIEELTIGIDTAIPCGLVVSELLSNSYKYAFPKGREGRITLTLRSLPEDQIELTLRDDGVGISPDLDIKTLNSLGLKLVYDLVELQMQGRIRLNRDNGTEFQIIFKELKYKKRI